MESLKYKYYSNNIKKKTFIKITIFLVIAFALNIQKVFAEEKIKIGLLVPLSGQDKEIGKSIIKSTRLAINKINNSSIEILPRDTASNPDTTFKNAKELSESGVKIISPIIGTAYLAPEPGGKKFVEVGQKIK